MNTPLEELEKEYAKVQKFARAVAAQPTDDLWDRIARLHEEHEAESEKAKNLVVRRPKSGNL